MKKKKTTEESGLEALNGAVMVIKNDLLVFGTVASASAGQVQKQQNGKLGFCGGMWGWPPLEAGEAGRRRKRSVIVFFFFSLSNFLHPYSCFL